MPRIIIAFVIFVSLVAAEVALSGGPLRVHAATAAALVVGFLLPAFFVGSVAHYRQRWAVVMGASVLGAVAFGALTSLAVVKAEFQYLWYIRYPLVAVGFSALLLTHALLVNVVSHTAAAN